MPTPTIYSLKSCGYRLDIPAPSSIDEYDKLAKRRGAAFEDALAYTAYRRTIPDFQALMIQELRKAVDFPPTPNELFASYNKRVRASLDEAGRKALDVTAQAIASSLYVDPTPGTYTGRIDKHLVEKTDAIYLRGREVVEAKLETYLGFFPKYPVDRDVEGWPDKNCFARLLGKYLNMLAASED